MRSHLTKSGTVPGYPSHSLIIATDAAVDQLRNRTGMAYLSTDGAWGFFLRPAETAGSPDSQVLACELRAVFYALDRTLPDGPVTVLTDSADAVAYLHAWQHGEDRYPPGYTPRFNPRRGISYLAALRKKVSGAPQRFTFQWQRGHEGHPLNEFADSAAKLALRTETGDAARSEASQLAPSWAQARLEEWGNYQEER